ncbi:hypothetical protein G3O00_41725 [Burkholderia sp. Ac-20384]|uniref:hypothetical protein n=1 Tax=Burkholderia sp. Ac-20384 TaxID=2703902 RepID=UPI0019809446|nr:hypothetical protein [Burkholderia sp. Ac-20384]MBN3830036.1 hypothetical protein [Burkholderia sp. Ac-20384]
MADPFNIRGFGPVPNYPESAPTAPQSASHPQPATRAPSQAALNQFGNLGTVRRPATNPPPAVLLREMINPESTQWLAKYARGDNQNERMAALAMRNAINYDRLEFAGEGVPPGTTAYTANLSTRQGDSVVVIGNFARSENGQFGVVNASLIDTSARHPGIFLAAPLDTTTAQNFSVEAGPSAPNTQPFAHATVHPGTFAPAGFHAPLPTDQPALPIASGSQHPQPGFGAHPFMSGAASAAPFSSYGEPSGSSAQPQDFATPSSRQHVAQRPVRDSPQPIASSSRNTLPLAGPSAGQSEATFASTTAASQQLTGTDRSIVNTLFSHIREENFMALSPAERDDYVNNFTPSAQLSIRGTSENSVRALRAQIRVALRKIGLLPKGQRASNVYRLQDEADTLATITHTHGKKALGGFMTDLRQHRSSFGQYKLTTPKERQAHIDRYLLGKSSATKSALKRALRELKLSGTEQ